VSTRRKKTAHGDTTTTRGDDVNYRLPDKDLTVNPSGSIPTITFNSNLSSTHFHVQVKTLKGWQMVVDSAGLGNPVPIKGGPIGSAADFPGKTLFWDITLASDSGSDPIEAVLEVVIGQDGNTLLSVDDDHSITGQESYYEYLNSK
jgi:hypothetical protein